MKSTILASSSLRASKPRVYSPNHLPCSQSHSPPSRSLPTANLPRTFSPAPQQALPALRRPFKSPPSPIVSNRRVYATTPAQTTEDPKANATPEDGGLRLTELHDLHLEKGGKMVPFGGYNMPVLYEDLSVGDSHRWTRERCSLFDVGHMVQHHISGPGATAFLEKITPSALANLPQNSSTLSCLLLPFTGGIVDDCVITRLGPELFYVVTNAACRKKDLAFLQENLDQHDESVGKVEWQVRDGWGLVALQGPMSVDILRQVLQKLGREDIGLEELYFGTCVSVSIPLKKLGGTGSGNADILISRGGYTGEDGFEISVPPNSTRAFTDLLLSIGGVDRVRLAGLGARDSLRLEAGMCLYGHDLDEHTTPVEAGLSWVIAKDRRDAGGFHGHETIAHQLRPMKEGGGVERRRVGLTIEGAPAREGAEILGPDGESAVGHITSGCPSPTLGKNIAMGYVKTGLHKSGTKVKVRVRGKERQAEVTKMPFLPSKYWKKVTGTTPA